MQITVFGEGPARGGKIFELQKKEPIIDRCKGLAVPPSAVVLTDAFFQRVKGNHANLMDAEFDAAERKEFAKIFAEVYPGVPLIIRMMMAGETRGIGLGKSMIFTPIWDLDTNTAIFENRLAEVLASGWTPDSKAYRKRKGLEDAVDILVMPLIGKPIYLEDESASAAVRYFMPEYAGIAYTTFGVEPYVHMMAAEGLWADELSKERYMSECDPERMDDITVRLDRGYALNLQHGHPTKMPTASRRYAPFELARRFKQLERECDGMPQYLEFVHMDGTTYIVQIADAPERKLPNLIENAGFGDWGARDAIGVGDILCERIVSVRCYPLSFEARETLATLNEELAGTRYLLHYPSCASSSCPDGNEVAGAKLRFSEFYNAGALVEWGDLHAGIASAHVRGLFYDSNLLFLGSGADDRMFDCCNPEKVLRMKDGSGEIRVINKRVRAVVDDRVSWEDDRSILAFVD